MRPFWQQWLLGPGRLWSAIALVSLTALALKPAHVSEANVPPESDQVLLTRSEATATARSQQRQQQERQIRPENFDLGRFPVTEANEAHWRNILWTTAVVAPQDGFVTNALTQILSLGVQSGLSNGQMRTVDAASRVATQLYLSNPTQQAAIGEQFLQLIERSPDREWVAVALSALKRAGLPANQLQALAARIKSRFPDWSRHVSLYTTLQDTAIALSSPTVPPLRDLLNWTVAPKQLHLYVLCRPNRDLLCQAVLKDRDGRFVRQNGQLWSVPLLLRSIHNLSWNFVRGQTPQGLYRIEGIVPQPDNQFFRAYGQFSLVNLFVPFESGSKQFIPGRSGPFNGTLTDYQAMLPPSWRSHWAMQQSYWAGKAGRSLFRIHGSGESPDFFSGKTEHPDSYNWNPTIGCLSALELYNEKGQLLQADMPKLLGALRMAGGARFAGYLIVVDVPGDAQQPLALAEVERAIASTGNPSGSEATSRSTAPQKQSRGVAPAQLVANRITVRSTAQRPPRVVVQSSAPPPTLTEAPRELQEFPIAY